MRLSGFTYIRNGNKLDYPFVESIRSALPICDEMVVVVGDSSDGTRESIEAIGSDKIKIIDTVWDDDLKGGLVFREQTNIGLDHIKGDWGLHIQADEILHENERDQIKAAIDRYESDTEVEGILFRYLHFWGYDHVIAGRRARRYEIRVVRNNARIRSYKDSQGFRIYPTPQAQDEGHHGEKLKVALIHPFIYHYSRVRPPELEMKKVWQLAGHLHGEPAKKHHGKSEWDYSEIDSVKPFPRNGHPEVMHTRVENASWKFDFEGGKFHLKNWLSNKFESLTGHRIGEYTNWNIIRRM